MPANSQLTDEVKDLIWKYVVTVVWPGAAAISILSGVVGYFAHSVAYGTAYAVAYSESTKSIIDTSNRAATAAAEAEALRGSAKVKDDQSQALLDAVNELHAKASAIVQSDYAALASELLKNASFSSQLVQLANKTTSEIIQRLTVLEGKIPKDGKIAWGDTIQQSNYGGGGVCPDGTVLVGAEFTSASGGSHGYLDAGRITCRNLILR